jgi:hypothetical protein
MPRVAASIRSTAADVGERHIDPGESERLGARDQPGKPQLHGGGVR